MLDERDELNMNKKLVYGLVGLGVVSIGVFTAQTAASYIEMFEPITQTIKAVSWDVDLGGGLGTQLIRPGKVVSSDVVTLINKNEYPVKFRIELVEITNTESETKLVDVLSFKLTQNFDDQVIIGEGMLTEDELVEKFIEVTVPGKEAVNAEDVVIELVSDVTWDGSDDVNVDINYQNQEVTYKYEITALEAFEEETSKDEADTEVTEGNVAEGLTDEGNIQ